MYNILPADQESGLISLLREEGGAIPFVRSNVPQAIMASEADNYIFGRTSNPYNRNFTCGGSSGGEGALIGGRCSCIGIGTDIAGSIRIPAHFCGITAFRPTPTRLSLTGLRANSLMEEGQHLVIASAGPMARSVEDLVSVLKIWLPSGTMPLEQTRNEESSTIHQMTGEESTSLPLISTLTTHIPRGLWDIDPRVPPLPFNTMIYENHQQRLRIGVFTFDNFFTPAVSCTRAVSFAASLLAKDGHTVISWNPIEKANIDLREAVLAYGILVNKDVIYDIMVNQLHLYEPLHFLYRTFLKLSSIPDTFNIRKAIAWIYRHIFHYPRIADIILATGSYSASDLYKWNAIRNRMCEKLLHAMQSDNIDLLLCPTVGLPAWPHNYMNYLEASTSYCWLWNYFGLPAGVVPVSFTEKNEHSHVPYANTVSSYEANDPITKFTQRTLEELDQAVLNSGQAFPLTVQVVGKPYSDELVLRGMKSIETLIEKYEPAVAERIRNGPTHIVPFPITYPSSPKYIYD